MIQDYEIKRKRPTIERVMPYAEFVLILIILQCILSFFTGSVTAEEETIRFRLLANSNTVADQLIKEEIQLQIEPLINQAVATSTSKKELGNNLAAIETTILDIATSIAGETAVVLERKEARFPAKRSGFIIQPQADYDAYVLTIGSGRGDNWWCAMFPRICFPDKVESEVAEEEKVTFFVWEWIKGLFS